MTQIRFLKLSLALPILLPLGFWQLATSGIWIAEGSDFLSHVIKFLVFSPLIGGVQYVAFVLIVLWLLRGRRLETYVRVYWQLPLWFSLFLGAFMLVLLSILGIDNPMIGAAGFAAFAVAFGFSYVAIVQALRRILTQMGVLTRAG